MPLSSTDPAISSLISKECLRQTEGAELIASENYTSDNVMEAQGSILTNKYVFIVIFLCVTELPIHWQHCLPDIPG